MDCPICGTPDKPMNKMEYFQQKLSLSENDIIRLIHGKYVLQTIGRTKYILVMKHDNSVIRWQISHAEMFKAETGE